MPFTFSTTSGSVMLSREASAQLGDCSSTVEQISIGWLKDLFGLPAGWSGVITTGATMANFVGLAAARRWWGLEQGVDIEAAGMGSLPPMTILSSGYVHVSALKAVSMLGLGRDRVRTLSRDDAGHLDLHAMEAALRELDGKPVVIIANAGDVNTGDFDPLAEIVAIARKHRVWVHVDGAFGLFAAVSPQTRHLVDGIELVDWRGRRVSRPVAAALEALPEAPQEEEEAEEF